MSTADTRDDDVEVISAKEMPTCAPCIVTVHPNGSVSASDLSEHRTTLDSVSTSPVLSAHKLELNAKREQIMSYWRTLKIEKDGVKYDMLRDDGTLPPGVPALRFPGGEMDIELETDEPVASGGIPFS